MAYYNEAFKIPVKPPLRINRTEPVSLSKYDKTCPKCGGHGYCVTNDGGSVGGCLKCGITYKPTIVGLSQQKFDGSNVLGNRRCATCGLTSDNHNVYHLFR